MLRKRYGITLEEFKHLVDIQEGRCAICNDIPEEILHTDHDHTTGKVRSLLCQGCNLLLGKIENNRELVQKMFDYLSQHTEAIESATNQEGA